LRKEFGTTAITRKVGNTHKEALQKGPAVEMEIRSSFNRGSLVEQELGGAGDLTELPKTSLEPGTFDQQDAFELIRLRNGTQKDFDELKSKIAGHDTWEVWIEKRIVTERPRKSTVGQWRSNLSRLSKWFGRPYLQDMTEDEAVAYKDLLLTQISGPSTRKVLSNIKGFWSWAKDNKQVKTNIWEGLTKRIKDSDKKPLPPEPLFVAATEKAVANRDYRYLIMRYTGCRSNEASGLRNCDIDLKNRTISFVEWKNGDVVRYLKGARKDERTIPINDALFKALEGIELNDSIDPIWPRSFKPGNESWGESWASDFKAKYGQGHKFTSHDLRSRAVTQLGLNGVSPFIIFSITRQKVPGMSEVVAGYVKPTTDQLRDAMELLT
jgi:integrase